MSGAVRDSLVFDDGSGPILYVAGDFRTHGETTLLGRVAKWDGTTWSSVGQFQEFPVSALTIYDDGHVPKVIVGSDNVPSSGILQWDGVDWSPFPGSGFFWTEFDSIKAMTAYNDGSDSLLIVGGSGVDTSIVQWDGTAWSSLGTGLRGPVQALKAADLREFIGLIRRRALSGGNSWFWSGRVGRRELVAYWKRI